MTRSRAGDDPALAERFVKALVITAKAVVHYPSSSTEPLKIAVKAVSLLNEMLRTRSELRLVVQPDGIRVGDEAIFPGVEAYQSFARALGERGVQEVRFRVGTTARDLVALFSTLDCPATELEAAGGAEARLWERGVSSITVSADIRRPPEGAGGPAVQGAEHDSGSGQRVDSLMAALAAESDPSVRRALVAQLSSLAPGHVEELGAYTADHRWYVVRNVVSALGSTGMTDVIPYLAQTARHPEARVRRETIRALSSIDDARSHPLLIAALDDMDAQNVQLAARYLGHARVLEAVTALGRLAAGEGRGNRETGTRTEAIEALGSIGAREAVPVLAALATKRTRARGDSLAIRTAAEASLAHIQQTKTPTKEQAP